VVTQRDLLAELTGQRPQYWDPVSTSRHHLTIKHLTGQPEDTGAASLVSKDSSQQDFPEDLKVGDDYEQPLAKSDNLKPTIPIFEPETDEPAANRHGLPKTATFKRGGA
jgi:hypothetical protein